MTALVWDLPEDRTYETGISKGVLYGNEGKFAVWNGLISVSETSEESKPAEVIFDGIKVNNQRTRGFYSCDVTALSFPKNFLVAIGSQQPRPGFTLTNQPKEYFDFSYQTMIGDSDYFIHLVYNSYASQTAAPSKTIGKTTTPSLHKFKIVTVPPEQFSDHRASSHILIDSRKVNTLALADLEEILYGTVSTDPYFPSQEEVFSIL